MRTTDRVLRHPLLTSKYAIFALIWASVFLLRSHASNKDDRTAETILLQPLWLARIFWQDATWTFDLTIALALLTLNDLRSNGWTIPRIGHLQIEVSSDATLIYIRIFALLAVLAVFAGIIVARGRQLEDETQGSTPEEREDLLPALIIPSRTTHSRIFPQKHSFSYSYLYVGIPVGLHGRVGSSLSADVHLSPAAERQYGWFDVNSVAYLERDGSGLGLKDKLSKYLRSQGVQDSDYHFAYLVTAPRFLGYSFNPVSFWYLYDANERLKYMILEVNNTFDERRMYLLNAEQPKNDSGIDLLELSGVDSNVRKETIFTNSWTKDFHVSPFNSRKGSYSLKAVDPLAAYKKSGRLSIDNTIVLHSSGEHAKLVARVFSEGEPQDPVSLGTLQLSKFIAAWWWVGLMTFPRIAKEAWKLYFKRNLHVWFRPEVAEGSVGRNANADEMKIERFFRLWLGFVVNNTEGPLRVIYQPPSGDAEDSTFASPSFIDNGPALLTFKIRVLSPAFYSRFIHYSFAKEAFDRECLCTDEKNRTGLIKQNGALSVFLKSAERLSRSSAEPDTVLGFVEGSRWKALQHLRCPPATPSYLNSSPTPGHYAIKDIRTFPMSELDRFVRKQCADSAAYRRTVVKLFAAVRFCSGIPGLVALVDVLIRVAIIVGITYYLEINSVSAPTAWTNSIGSRDIAQTMTGALLANIIHLWTFIKG